MRPYRLADIIITSGANAGTYWYHFDALGSVVALSKFDSGSGLASVVERYAYSAFGQTTVCDASGTPRASNVSLYGNSYMFTGREYESETGLYCYRARYYKPEIGRFLQTDPVGYLDSANLYQYCGNNPVNWIDPWGLWSEGAHRRLGDYGNGTDMFDYAQLDIDFPATESYENRVRHFRPIGSAVNDARAAARRGDKQAFEYHMHEVQDFYAHYKVGYRARFGHWTHGTDDPTKPENRTRYKQADAMTKNLERYWDEQNKKEALLQ